MRLIVLFRIVHILNFCLEKNMFAVIESGGKQHTVSEGENLKVELLSNEEGSIIEFDKVLMISNGSESKIGNPYVENAFST